MNVFLQILSGSAVLFLCAILHVAAIVAGVSALRQIRDRLGAAILAFGLLVILAAHSIQIWVWALAFQVVGAFVDFESSIYFAITTYTTLGYGDLILDQSFRLFATFAAVTGLLSFGISTAFLVSLITRLLPAEWRD